MRSPTAERPRRKLALLVLLLAACSGSPGADDSCVDDPVVTESGLSYHDLDCGRGAEVARGDAVTVRYLGRVKNGPALGPTRSVTFKLGSGQVIRGWEEGIPGMRVGGRRMLVIPPELAYGQGGFPPRVPANARVEFEIEVVEARPVELPAD
jgi:FKBP-type peptidyl-prolyl cis-trans isomerase